MDDELSFPGARILPPFSLDTRCFNMTFYIFPSLTCFCSRLILRAFFLWTFELFVFEFPVVCGLDGDSGGKAMLEKSLGACSFTLFDLFFVRA